MSDSPGSIVALLGCLAWIPIAIWVYSLISWSILGEIDALLGMLGSFMGLVVGVAIMLQPNEELTPYLVLTVFAMVLAFPAMRSYHHRRQLAQIDIDAMADAYEQLSLRPGNLGATMRIARVAQQRGWVGHAVAIAEPALAQFPKAIVADELRELNSWKYHVQPHHRQAMSCLECATPAPPGQLWCSKCGTAVLLAHARGAWLGTRSARRFMAAWLAGVASLIGIPAAASLLPPAIAGIFVVMFVVLSGGVLWWAFRAPRRVSSGS